MTPRRLKSMTLLSSIVTSGLILLAWTQDWFTLAVSGTDTSTSTLSVAGSTAAPGSFGAQPRRTRARRRIGDRRPGTPRRLRSVATRDRTRRHGVESRCHRIARRSLDRSGHEGDRCIRRTLRCGPRCVRQFLGLAMGRRRPRGCHGGDRSVFDLHRASLAGSNAALRVGSRRK